MTYKDILRAKPWLTICHIGNVSARLLQSTRGNAFIVWNNIQQEYQLHTVSSELLSGDSTNANIPIDVLNEWIISDYNMNDFDKYVDDIMSSRQLSEHIREAYNSNEHRECELNQQIKVVERALGTKL